MIGGAIASVIGGAIASVVGCAIASVVGGAIASVIGGAIASTGAGISGVVFTGVGSETTMDSVAGCGSGGFVAVSSVGAETGVAAEASVDCEVLVVSGFA